MARVTYGALITELAGSIGGITFQRNASGPVARLKPNMTVNPSPAQALQENKLSRLVALWPTLSDADKLSWKTFAEDHLHVTEWAEEKQLNGFQWFMSCNLDLLVTNQATITTAPAWTTVDPLPAFTLPYTVSYFRIQWDPPIDLTGYRIVIYATPPIRQSSMKLRRSTFILRIADIGAVTYFDLMTYYQTLFNVTWADIFNDANCSIIVRAKKIQELTGLAGPFTSALIKIN